MARLRILVSAFASVVGALLLGAGTAAAAGTITFVGTPGTAAPPPTLGPYTMTAFPLDLQPVDTPVAGTAAPLGTVTFDPQLVHERIGNGWLSWSHGYRGDVYWTAEATSATVVLPPRTAAFYLYAEPNPLFPFTISATADDGTSSGAVTVEGEGGATYFGFYATGGEFIDHVTISSPVSFAIGEFAVNTPVRSYVALGDEYASGDGTSCVRSPLAYPQVLGGHYGMTPKVYACGGATASDVTGTQVEQPGVDPSADLATLTIGLNDAALSDAMTACIAQKLKAGIANVEAGPVSRWLGLDRQASCVESDAFTSSVNTRIDNVFGPVRSAYGDVKSATDPAYTSVIAAGYPLLFPSDPRCAALSSILTNDDMAWLNGATDRLDAVLQQAAGEAGVNFVDVRSTFAGHEVCGAGGSFFTSSFQPNASGQAAYAAAIQAKIDSATHRNAAGFPLNPAALPETAATSDVPAIGFGPLTAHPVTPAAEGCANMYQAGQQVSVSGDGFAPGAPVPIVASSGGFGDKAELVVGLVRADGNGHIDATVRVPFSATGFEAAPVVVLDAISLGTAVRRLDDVTIIGLAPHDGTCGTVEPLPFDGFRAPIGDGVNRTKAGRTIPVKFAVPGARTTFDAIVAAGYPQSAPVSCTAPGEPTTGTPTIAAGRGDDDEDAADRGSRFRYDWKTSRDWRGCRALIVKLVDGTYHRAVFDFGS